MDIEQCEEVEIFDEETAADAPVTVRLKYPITHGRQVIEEMTFRPITGADYRRVRTPKDHPLAMTMEFAGYLSGQPTQVIDKLKGADLRRVTDVVGGFLSGSPETGPEQ
jgi:hypothetical protein